MNIEINPNITTYTGNVAVVLGGAYVNALHIINYYIYTNEIKFCYECYKLFYQNRKILDEFNSFYQVPTLISPLM